ncbi:MAG: hypothetical protein B7X79_04795 [Acidovorax sp. 17-64-282]|nr:MAG: hypothetical protein B7Y46_07155 [Acidovorax sp. 28-64-14]OYZ65708.1 MAG: hypothetical protein B7Y14_18775 [Acidovorax sp. 24-64-9]OZA57881.1 MAG: hypothetical protein B7X79_04795 [Acidovorax sp. 17-64-282]
MVDLNQRCLSVIFITHDLRVAAQVCHQIAVMHQGRMVEYGPPNEVFDRPRNDYTKRLIAAIPGKHWSPIGAGISAG